MKMDRHQKDGGDRHCIIIGAGPAGLTAAYELLETGVVPVVFEQDELVGGIARTVEHSGYRFDIGGHRFFTKVKLIDEWWKNMLQDDFLVRSRTSRIYYNNTFFDYPLKPLDAMVGLGPVESLRIVISYIRSLIFPHPEENSFEQWVCNRFGARLYEVFFKSYTEKVWGMKCSEISADWAAQRIKNLDFLAAIRSMFLGNKGNEITTLIRQFHYPRLGPGMMWERTAQILSERGFPVRLGQQVTKVHLKAGRFSAVTVMDRNGNEVCAFGEHLISSMPLQELIAALGAEAPIEVAEASRELRYRDFITVGLIVNKPDLFHDNWIYIHSPKVKVGRIQNFKNWSPDMVLDPSKTSLGLEYFVQKDDELWSAKDEELIDLARNECAELGLVNPQDVIDGIVIRTPNAYPVYDRSYRQALSTIRGYLDTIPNLEVVGRNGQHRYNNQDHSMLTGIYAAQNVCGAHFDVWDVNVEAEHVESPGRESKVWPRGERLVPHSAEPDPLPILQSAFAGYDPIALGCALAVVAGVGLFCLTAVLLIANGNTAGPNLSLLGIYFFGYEVTWRGAVVGFFEVGIFCFLLGFVLAHAINGVTRWHARRLFRKLEVMTALQKLDEGR